MDYLFTFLRTLEIGKYLRRESLSSIPLFKRFRNCYSADQGGSEDPLVWSQRKQRPASLVVIKHTEKLFMREE